MQPRFVKNRDKLTFFSGLNFISFKSFQIQLFMSMISKRCKMHDQKAALTAWHRLLLANNIAQYSYDNI